MHPAPRGTGLARREKIKSPETGFLQSIFLRFHGGYPSFVHFVPVDDVPERFDNHPAVTGLSMLPCSGNPDMTACENQIRKTSRLSRHEPEFIFRYLDLKPYTAAVYPGLPDHDTGKTEKFFYQEKSLEGPPVIPGPEYFLLFPGRDSGTVIFVHDMEDAVFPPGREADDRDGPVPAAEGIFKKRVKYPWQEGICKYLQVPHVGMNINGSIREKLDRIIKCLPD